VAHSIQAAFAAAEVEALAIDSSDSLAPGRPPVTEQLPAARSERVPRPSWLRTGTVGITKHAAERYRERFEPDLSPDEAKPRLRERLNTDPVTFTKVWPRWASAPAARPGDVPLLGYVILDRDVALPLRETPKRADPTNGNRIPYHQFYVVTCLYLWLPVGTAAT
jgi:hypothetical protein